MRLLHLIGLVFGVALVFALARDPAGRVTVVVFFVGVAEVAVALTALMSLFQTIGSIGEARSPLEHAQAFVATAVVTFVCATFMVVIFRAGIVLVNAVVPS